MLGIVLVCELFNGQYVKAISKPSLQLRLTSRLSAPSDSDLKLENSTKRGQRNEIELRNRCLVVVYLAMNTTTGSRKTPLPEVAVSCHQDLPRRGLETAISTARSSNYVLLQLCFAIPPHLTANPHGNDLTHTQMWFRNRSNSSHLPNSSLVHRREHTHQNQDGQHTEIKLPHEPPLDFLLLVHALVRGSSVAQDIRRGQGGFAPEAGQGETVTRLGF